MFQYYLTFLELHSRTLTLLLILLLSIGGNVIAITRYSGSRIFYLPVGCMGEANTVQSAQPGDYPIAVQTHLAELVVRSLGNVTPDSLLSAVQRVRPYLEPSTYVNLHALASNEIKTMKDADLAIMTTDIGLIDLTPLEYQGRPFHRLKFTGVRHLFSFGMVLESHQITVIVDVMPPTVGLVSLDPDPLLITHLEWPELKIKSGEFQNFSFTTEQLVRGIKKKFHRGVTRQ